MTILQIAREECSNFQPDGTCAGLDFTPQGKHFRFKPAGEKCVLGTKGVRCPFFEQCVMPMDRSALTVGPRKEWEDCLKQYRTDCNVGPQKRRICPICRERELEPSKRYCYVCRAEKRRETWRGNK